MIRALALIALTGCSVDRGPLDTHLFQCATDSDCGAGWGCVRATPITPDFCAPLCNGAPCDGICTGGENPQCLRGCRINPDGTTSACPSSDYECVRTSVESDDGLCYPVDTCNDHAECGAEELCLSQILRDQAPAGAGPFDHLYCVPSSREGVACPPGFKMGSQSPEARACLAGCSTDDRRCPPGFGCLDILGYVAPYLTVEGLDGPVCEIGTFGFGCEDDSNCFVGHCEDTTTAQGSVCTLSCNDASARYGGCGNMLRRSILGLFGAMECDPALGPDGGLCVARYGLGFPRCTTEAGSAYRCGAGLDCRPFELPPPSGTVNFCTRDCTMDAECNPVGSSPETWEFTCQGLRCFWRPGT